MMRSTHRYDDRGDHLTWSLIAFLSALAISMIAFGSTAAVILAGRGASVKTIMLLAMIVEAPVMSFLFTYVILRRRR
jgi:hypothetical protein